MRYTESIHPALGETAGGTAIPEGVLLIPGRPQSKLGTPEFERWRMHASRAVLDQIERSPLIPEGFLELQLDLYYPLEMDRPTANDLAEHRIPRITAAAEPVLIALSGLLFQRRGQISSLSVTRIVRPSSALQEEWGEAWRRGGVRVRYCAEESNG
ncbi:MULTISPECIES: hypothetical protein [unclassified Meiothermus]|uniref:hypothetical protein n=1 Tax=unclassified Meiothermus TaxID=370471 RepID=UPI0010229833|nr:MULTISPECIES: hypothetical protein [unclassified Meiothermus]RYM40751.1 hypothetical protein EWH23_01095 [Meiothermus sp. PNK-Is4]